jgi:uncharacterized protein YejL (UPF0352 family)
MTDTAADQLAYELIAVLNRCDDRSDRFLAAMMVLGDLVASIDCPSCRKQSKKAIQRTLPKILAQAMAQPTSESQHVH